MTCHHFQSAARLHPEPSTNGSSWQFPEERGEERTTLLASNVQTYIKKHSDSDMTWNRSVWQLEWKKKCPAEKSKDIATCIVW